MFESTDYPTPDQAWWDIPWQQCYRDFARHLWERSHSTNTVENYAGTLTRFFDSARLPPQAVTRRDVEAFASRPALIGPRGAPYLSDKPVAARTRNSRIAIIKSFYDYACGYEYTDLHGKLVTLIERNPTRGVKAAKETPAHRTMSEAEFTQFIAAIPRDGQVIHARDRAAFLCLFWSCKRRSELCSLTWGAIQPAIFVDPKTKATRAGWVYSVATKGSGGGVYTAELPAPAMEAIQEYIRVSGRIMQPDSPVFASIGPPSGGYGLDPYLGLSGMGLYMRMKEYLRLAGMDERLSPHSIRHAGALTRYRNGSGVLDIMRVLGHRHLNTTQVYLEELHTEQDLGALLLLEKFGNL